MLQNDHIKRLLTFTIDHIKQNLPYINTELRLFIYISHPWYSAWKGSIQTLLNLLQIRHKPTSPSAEFQLLHKTF